MAATVNVGTLEGLLRWKADDADIQRSLNDIAKKANISRTTLNQYGKELVAVENAYKKVAASLDPAIARQQKYEQNVRTLNAALKAGVITQQQYNVTLAQAKDRLQDASTWTSRFAGEVGTSLKSSIGPYFAIGAVVTAVVGTVKSVIGQFITANIEAEESQRRVEFAVAKFGDRSGVTAQQIENLAEKYSLLTGVDDEVIADAETLALKYNRISSDVLPQLTQLSLDMAETMGGDVSAAMQKAAAYTNLPLNALTKLKKEGYAVSDSQAKLVKDMLRTGDIAGAQAEIIKILESQYGGASIAARDTLGGALKALGTTWENLLEKVGEDRLGALRGGIEKLIDLLITITDWVDKFAIGALKARSALDELDIAAFSVIGKLSNFSSLFNPFAAFFDIGDKANKQVQKSTEDLLNVQTSLLDSFGLIPSVTHSGARGTLELTEAEHKLADALNTVKDQINDLRVSYSNAIKQREAFAKSGPIGLRNEIDQQQASAAVLKLQNALKKEGASLTATQIKLVTSLVIGEKEEERQLHSLQKAYQFIGTLAYVPVDALEKTEQRLKKNMPLYLEWEQLQKKINKDFSDLLPRVDALGRGFNDAFNLSIPLDLISQALDLTEQMLTAEEKRALAIARVVELYKVLDSQGNHLISSETLRRTQQESANPLFDSAQQELYDFRQRVIDSFTSIADSSREEMAKVEHAFAGFEDDLDLMAVKEQALAAIRFRSLEDNLSQWQSLFGFLGDQFGGIFQKIHNWIGQIQQALQAAQSLKLASGGFDSSALGAAFTKYGTYAAYGFLAWVGLKIYEGWTKARTKFGEASLGGGTSGDRRIAEQISQVITDLTQQVTDLALQWHLGLVSLTRGSVTIGANSDGSIIVKSLIDNVGRVFKTMSEALDYAKVQALKFATFSEQTSELVRAAILKSRATTSEGLQADIDFANRLATQNLTELEGQFHSFLQTFVEDFRHLMALFGPGQLRSLGDFTQLGAAAESAITSLLGGIQGMYDQLTGHKVDQDAIDERNRVAFNAQRAIVIAQLTLLYEEIKARIAEYQVRLRILQSGVLGGNATGPGPGSGEGNAGFSKGGGVLLQDNRNPTGDGGLAALLQVLDNLARAMQGLPPEIAPGGVHHGGGRGGGAGAARDSVRSFIDDRSFQLSLVGLDDFHQKLAQITRDYAPQLAAAGKDKKLREQLLALQERETAAAIKAHDEEVAARQADLRTQFTQLVAPDAFEQAIRQFEEMKKEIEKAGFGADETAKMVAALTAAEVDAIQKLANQQFASLVSELSNVVADSETNAEQHKLHNELLRAQEIINYQMKIIELRAEYQLLRAKGVLTQQEIALLDKAFGWIDTHSNVLPGGANWIPSFEQVSTAASDISQAAGNQSDAADKLRAAVESLIDYQTSLHTDASLGLVDPRTALDNAKADYEENRRKALAGDTDAIAHFKDFAETYRRNLIAFSPSSELTASVLAGIDDTINNIKGLRSVQAALSSDGQAIVGGLNAVSSGVSMVHAVAAAVNDNTTAAKDSLAALTPDAIADAAKSKQADYLTATLTAQQASAEALRSVSADIKELSSNVLAWRTEARGNVDEAYEQLTGANDKLAAIVANTKHPKKLAGTGG